MEKHSAFVSSVSWVLNLCGLIMMINLCKNQSFFFISFNLVFSFIADFISEIFFLLLAECADISVKTLFTWMVKKLGVKQRKGWKDLHVIVHLFFFFPQTVVASVLNFTSIHGSIMDQVAWMQVCKHQMLNVLTPHHISADVTSQKSSAPPH